VAGNKCDWETVALHLLSTFQSWQAMTSSPHVRMALLDAHGLSWPWESQHVETRAWFDHAIVRFMTFWLSLSSMAPPRMLDERSWEDVRRKDVFRPRSSARPRE
jgi:hypothetical protein